MDGVVARHTIELNIEALTTPQERGGVGSFEIDVRQGQDRSQEALRLTERQLEDEPEHQSGLDRMIGELSLTPSSSG
jgi:hypothetical protein